MPTVELVPVVNDVMRMLLLKTEAAAPANGTPFSAVTAAATVLMCTDKVTEVDRLNVSVVDDGIPGLVGVVDSVHVEVSASPASAEMVVPAAILAWPDTAMPTMMSALGAAKTSAVVVMTVAWVAAVELSTSTYRLWLLPLPEKS
jgi:hypothetical protein